MDRYQTSLICLAGLAGLAIGCNPSREKKPNVLLIMTDDQGYGDIQAHGSPYVKTPALDRLFREGIRLADFHVDPCCSPTRSALLTGQYSSRVGVWHTIGGRSLLKAGIPTIADVFAENGYRTAIFGKWHLGENYPFRPNDRGFQEAVVLGGGAIGNNPDYWGNDYYDDTYKHNGKFQKYQGYCNAVWFNLARDFIRESGDQPFFCYIPTNVPHAPLIVDSVWSNPYRSMVSDRLANYYGMVSEFDDDLGKLLNDLDDWNLADKTILIYLSDNGPCPWFGGIIIDKDGFVVEGYSAGMRGAKIWGYENAHRVPCYIRWPAGGLTGGRDIDQLTAHMDLLPTLMDLCKLTYSQPLHLDGRSLAPLLLQTGGPWLERTLFVHNQRVDQPVKYKEYQVMTEQWRLVKRDKDELYDIEADPGQRHDVAALHPDLVKELRFRYEKWWDDISTDFNTPARIIIGSDHENPAILYAHDARRIEGQKIWKVVINREAIYQFEPELTPHEAAKKLPDRFTSAHLRVGDQSWKIELDPFNRKPLFRVKLHPGETDLQAWFQDQNSDRQFYANYLYLNRL
ncbi:MAG: arylsulfatase [Bacteroidales bacterium]|nr:arylsulfatase [Bacteroidales bacterium]